MKLNRGKIIRQCVGEGLADFGFSYGGYKGDTWVFERKQGELIWFVYIYVYRFDRCQITFELGTNVRSMVVQAPQIKGIEGNGFITGYWKFHDEESLTRVLEEMVDVIRSQGVRFLKELSIPKKSTPFDDDEMHHELYLHHKELAEAFVQRTGMTVTDYDGENIKRWFDYIDNRIEEISRERRDDAGQRELMEIAAFLGEQIVKYKGGVWTTGEYNPKMVIITYMKKNMFKKKPIEFGINVLELVKGKYLGNTRWWIEEEFFKVIEE